MISLMSFLSYLVDIIYPLRCHLCGRFFPPHEDRPPPKQLCSDCRTALSPVTHPMCTICGLPFAPLTGRDHVCENCLRKTPWFDLARAPYLYTGRLMEAIHRFKYKSETHLISSLGPLLSTFAREWIHDFADLLTIPVPLHKRRLRARGFNQSLFLARVISRELATPLDYLSLIRTRHTRAQAGLSKEERRKNVRNAFSVLNSEIIEDKEILLVDDVFTTGHTLNECARTLKKSGARAVICLTLARVTVD
jgi:ComF family protein